MEQGTYTVAIIPVKSIQVGPRKRPIDPTAVREIAQSIERQGLLQPIGVKYLPDVDDERYALIFGAHRLEAIRLLDREAIDARILPDGLHEEEYLLMELQENCARNDLTRGQRKAYGAEIGRLCELLNKYDSANRTEEWFNDFAQTSNTPRRTAYDWWQTFCKETNRTLTPSQALELDRAAFFAWLDAEQAREAAEKARKEAEAFARRRQQDFADALENLQTLTADYGSEAVMTEVINVFIAWQGQS